MLVVLSAAVVAYLYNFFEVRTIITQFFATQDESYQLKWAELQEEDKLIGEKWVELDAKEAELSLREEELIDRSAKLDSREAGLFELENSLTNQRSELESAGMELTQMIETVSSMSASAAAEMLQSFNDVNRVALLLSKMEPSQTAKILKAMPPAVAAGITELIMSKNGQ